MSVLGIVAEYDPFHNGHLHHLQSAIAAVSPSSVLVALSGPFKQRGDPSFLSPFSRAECALKAGADAVLSLPVLWTVRDAEHYALGAVSVLSSLGATHLAFGAETPDLPLLQKIADLLEDPPGSMRNLLHRLLSEGNGYPSALSMAAGNCIPEAASVLFHPNNILAVCYLRAFRRLKNGMTPVIIPRTGSYHAEEADPVSPSASSVRNSILRGDWNTALRCLPYYSCNEVRSAALSGCLPSSERLDSLLLEKIRSLSPSQASLLPDCPEGLDTALLKAAGKARSRNELISMLTTRRYSSARISRLCTYALLGITKSHTEDNALPSSALLLGVKRNPSVTGPWKNSSVRLLSASSWKETASPQDLAAWRVWNIVCGFPSSMPFTQKLVSGK